MISLLALVCSVGSYFLFKFFGATVIFMDIIYMYFLMNISARLMIGGRKR